VGDALGAPVEFLGIREIRGKYGPAGITDYDVAYGRRGAITDDTQMTLFTAEGVLRAIARGNHKGICHPPSVLHHACVCSVLAVRRHWPQSKPVGQRG
jgi:hypothetical protein